MLQHGQGHIARLPFGHQVLGAHHPLQLGEFAHHLAHEIVFAEVGGTAGVAGGDGIEGQQLQQGVGEPLQPVHPVTQ